MKKIVALVLAVVLTAATLSITAAAYSDYDSGFYKGKAWNASLTVRDQYVGNSFSYAGGGNVKTVMDVTYFRSNNPGRRITTNCEALGKNGRASFQWDATNTGHVMIRATMSAFINGVVCTLDAAPDYYY